ncbi:unnamed protein product [Discosporangium mesarthrocarpum]
MEVHGMGPTLRQWQGEGQGQSQAPSGRQWLGYNTRQQVGQGTASSSMGQEAGWGKGEVLLHHQDHAYGEYQGQPTMNVPLAPANTMTMRGSSGGRVLEAGASNASEMGKSSGKAGRRKERDMERALASGNLDALGDTVPTKDLHQSDNDYNPLRQGPMPASGQRETVHIQASVYDPHTGKTKVTAEPTSTQRRKHQINQLAVQAAYRERELMEKRGASSLTKAQTQAKYGW